MSTHIPATNDDRPDRHAGAQTDKSAMIASAGRAPLKRRASLPLRKRIIVGMLRISNRAATPGSASVSTLATIIRPARWLATFAISGATARHGPHHAAQKSTRTGRGTSRTNSSNSSALPIETGFASGRSAALQAPHFAFSPRRAAGRRFEPEQDGHGTIIAPKVRPCTAASRSLWTDCHNPESRRRSAPYVIRFLRPNSK